MRAWSRPSRAGQQVEADLTAYVDVGEVQRGDVIVFRYPESPEHVFVKRVIGLPGETVSGKDGRIFINGVALSALVAGVKATERAGEATYGIRLASPCQDQPYKLSVPAGSLFVVGDNRCNSRDSRHWGFLPFPMVLGRVAALK